MGTHRFGFIGRASAAPLLALALSQLLPSPALGGAKVVETDGFSMELGMRMQPRLEVKPIRQRDILIRRARLKASGKMLDAKYGFEWKIDGTDQIGKDPTQVAASPTPAVENAWIQFPLVAGVEMRAGLYDQPYSRDRLTSDSRQLSVDRTEVSGEPDALGLADNAVGFDLRGKVRGGRAEYAVGLFDNRMLAGRFQDIPMVVGRLDLNFGSTESVFQDTHFGADSWYSVGLNGSYQGSIENATANHGSNAIGGMDAMIDVPAGAGRLFARGEASVIKVEKPGGGNPVDKQVWMASVGYLVLERLQPFVVFDQVVPDVGQARNITYLGANLYRKGHSLKLQADVRLESGNHESVDGGRLQAQVDF